VIQALQNFPDSGFRRSDERGTFYVCGGDEA